MKIKRQWRSLYLELNDEIKTGKTLLIIHHLSDKGLQIQVFDIDKDYLDASFMDNPLDAYYYRYLFTDITYEVMKEYVPFLFWN